MKILNSNIEILDNIEYRNLNVQNLFRILRIRISDLFRISDFRFRILAAVLVWAFSFIFYFVTLSPTIVWGDPAKLTNLAYLNYLRIHTANHALHNLIGRFWGKLPFADYAYGQNLLSAVFASLTVLLLFFVVHRVAKSVFAALVASFSLTVAHTFWWLAVINESYSLAFFLFVLAILLMITWFQNKKAGFLYLTAFALGLGISNHYMLAVFVPAFVVAALIDDFRLVLDYKKMLLCFISFVFGAGLLVYVYFTQYPPLTWEYMIESTDIESLGKMVRELVRYPLYLFYQFPLFGFALGLAGLWRSHKSQRGIFSLLLLIFMINYLFSAVYMWERQPNMMVFGYIIFAVWIGLGASCFLNKLKIKGLLVLAMVLLPLWLYSYAPYLAQKLGGNILNIRSLPYRNNDEYFLNPNKRGYFGARRFAEEVYSKVEPNAMVIADFTPYTVLRYLQLVEQRRMDVKLIHTWPDPKNPISQKIVEKNIQQRAVYLVDIDDYPDLYKTSVLSARYSFVKNGVIYRLSPKK